MAIAEHGRQSRVLDALGIEERPLGARLGQRSALEAQLLQRRLDFTFKITGKLRGTLKILAFGRDRDTARQVGLERPGIEIALGAGNGGGTGHEDGSLASARALMRRDPVCVLRQAIACRGSGSASPE